MRNATTLKPLATLALAACIAFCGIALTGCGEDSSQTSQTTETQTASQDEQDNCYGDDLPAINTEA